MQSLTMTELVKSKIKAFLYAYSGASHSSSKFLKPFH